VATIFLSNYYTTEMLQYRINVTILWLVGYLRLGLDT